MEQNSWQQRWSEGRIAFHRSDPHPFLRRHLDRLGAGSVYVPLCGKSLDLVFLREHGHDVYGTEFVGLAIAQFYAELGVQSAAVPLPPFRRHEGGGIVILEGDAFAIQPEHLGGPVDCVYDRGSLVAVDPPQRARLADSLCRVLRARGRILLVTMVYEQGKAAGPPWSVDDDAVRDLFGARGRVTLLDEQPDPGSPSLRAAGITEFVERAHLIELA